MLVTHKYVFLLPACPPGSGSYSCQSSCLVQSQIWMHDYIRHYCPGHSQSVLDSTGRGKGCFQGAPGICQCGFRLDLGACHAPHHQRCQVMYEAHIFAHRHLYRVSIRPYPVLQVAQCMPCLLECTEILIITSLLPILITPQQP